MAGPFFVRLKEINRDENPMRRLQLMGLDVTSCSEKFKVETSAKVSCRIAALGCSYFI